MLLSNRILISKSEMFNIINKKNEQDISFATEKVAIKNLSIPLEDIKTRQFPATRQIMQYIAEGKIEFLFKSGSKSSIIYLPVMSKDESKIIGVQINLSKLAKSKKAVNANTGDIEEVLSIDYNVLYNLLFGAVAILNTEKCYNNPALVRYLRTIYVDIMVNILSRSFGNAIYGDNLRFIIGYYFHNGKIPAKDLATLMKFDEYKANLLISKNQGFFSGNPVGIEDLLKIITLEFPNMKDVEIQKFIENAIVMLGDSAFYSIDNMAYYLGVVAVKCRKDMDIFTGFLLRNVEIDRGPIASAIIQSL